MGAPATLQEIAVALKLKRARPDFSPTSLAVIRIPSGFGQAEEDLQKKGADSGKLDEARMG